MIKKILEWALSKFEDKTPKIEAWPFSVVSKDFEPRSVKKKPVLKKATTHAKKPAVVAKTARTKKVK